MEQRISRRYLLSSMALSAAAMSLSACVGNRGNSASVGFDAQNRFGGSIQSPNTVSDADILAPYSAMYGAKSDSGFNLPAIPFKKIDPQFLRQVVADPTGEAPGTIVVDTKRRYLYLVRENNKAIRYGVGIGRAGFAWSGRAIIQYKKKWPIWTPPPEMIERQPELRQYSAENGSMKPGLRNPLGARALYIFQDGKDTLYRLHGSPEWWSIGKAMSSGCVRLINQDIIDLYDRVPEKSPILVV